MAKRICTVHILKKIPSPNMSFSCSMQIHIMNVLQVMTMNTGGDHYDQSRYFNLHFPFPSVPIISTAKKIDCKYSNFLSRTTEKSFLNPCHPLAV